MLGPLDHAADVAGHGGHEVFALEGVERLGVDPRQLTAVHGRGDRAHAQVTGRLVELDVATAVEHPAQDRLGDRLWSDHLTRLGQLRSSVRPCVLAMLHLLGGLVGDGCELFHVVLEEQRLETVAFFHQRVDVPHLGVVILALLDTHPLVRLRVEPRDLLLLGVLEEVTHDVADGVVELLGRRVRRLLARRQCLSCQLNVTFVLAAQQVVEPVHVLVALGRHRLEERGLLAHGRARLLVPQAQLLGHVGVLDVLHDRLSRQHVLAGNIDDGVHRRADGLHGLVVRFEALVNLVDQLLPTDVVTAEPPTVEGSQDELGLQQVLLGPHFIGDHAQHATQEVGCLLEPTLRLRAEADQPSLPELIQVCQRLFRVSQLGLGIGLAIEQLRELVEDALVGSSTLHESLHRLTAVLAKDGEELVHALMIGRAENVRVQSEADGVDRRTLRPLPGGAVVERLDELDVDLVAQHTGEVLACGLLSLVAAGSRLGVVGFHLGLFDLQTVDP